MQALHFLAAPKPDTSHFNFPAWVDATIALVLFGLIFGAIFRWLYKKEHKGLGIFFGVLALLAYTAAAAVLSDKQAVRYLMNIGKDVGKNITADAREEGVPFTFAGIALALAIFLAVYFLFGRNNQASGILVGLFFGFSLLVAADYFEWVSWILAKDYRLLEILSPL